ncbi:MAG: hypothetical protein ACUVTO_03790 [Candidatus Caldatribacteriaceae bacterium]
MIFSRWDTRDLISAKVAPGGWTESAGYEGGFISVHKSYNWKARKYSTRVAYIRSNLLGDWYGVWIVNESVAREDCVGSLRFLQNSGRDRSIADDGGTWTEIYYRETTPLCFDGKDRVYRVRILLNPEHEFDSRHGSVISTFAVGVDGVAITENYGHTDLSDPNIENLVRRVIKAMYRVPPGYPFD